MGDLNATASGVYPLSVCSLGFPQALKNLETTKKSSMHGKIMEFEKNLNNHGKIMEFCEIMTKPQVARKLAVGHLFQVLINSKCMHGLQTCCCCCIAHLCSAW